MIQVLASLVHGIAAVLHSAVVEHVHLYLLQVNEAQLRELGKVKQ